MDGQAGRVGGKTRDNSLCVTYTRAHTRTYTSTQETESTKSSGHDPEFKVDLCRRPGREGRAAAWPGSSSTGGGAITVECDCCGVLTTAACATILDTPPLGEWRVS